MSTIFRMVHPSLVPRPHAPIWEKGLVTIERFLGCAESVCHVTCNAHVNTHQRNNNIMPA